ncbi:unnamed protein product, partial [Durusdinium trenchii]
SGLLRRARAVKVKAPEFNKRTPMLLRISESACAENQRMRRRPRLRPFNAEWMLCSGNCKATQRQRLR